MNRGRFRDRLFVDQAQAFAAKQQKRAACGRKAGGLLGLLPERGSVKFYVLPLIFPLPRLCCLKACSHRKPTFGWAVQDLGKATSRPTDAFRRVGR